jgi:hypothetical protein
MSLGAVDELFVSQLYCGPDDECESSWLIRADVFLIKYNLVQLGASMSARGVHPTLLVELCALGL